MKKKKIVNGVVLLMTLFICGCGGKEPLPRQAPIVSAPPAELQSIWNDPEALFEKGQELYKKGDLSLSFTALKRVVEGFPKSNVYAKAQELSKEVEARLGEAKIKIGVLLPLSGQFGRFGEAVLDGIACALALYDPCGEIRENIQIVVKDTRGNANLAAHGVTQLVSQEKVAAVIGPLLSAETEMAAIRAQELNVPIILLSPKKRAKRIGTFVFQHSLVPENEVHSLVRKSLQAGVKDFIILYPKNPYGRRYFQLFTEELEKIGAGKVIAELGYAPDLPDFVEVLKRFTNWPAVRTALEHKNKQLGFFIPDSYRQIASLANAFDQLGIVGPRMIGTQRWHHPDLLRHPFASLEGALIATPFSTAAGKGETQHFANTFTQAFGNKPAWLEAIGYDAARIVADALRSTGNGYPPEVRDAIARIGGFPGVVGKLSWDAQGNSVWDLDFVTVENGTFVPF